MTRPSVNIQKPFDWYWCMSEKPKLLPSKIRFLPFLWTTMNWAPSSLQGPRSTRVASHPTVSTLARPPWFGVQSVGLWVSGGLGLRSERPSHFSSHPTFSTLAPFYFTRWPTHGEGVTFPLFVSFFSSLTHQSKSVQRRLSGQRETGRTS